MLLRSLSIALALPAALVTVAAIAAEDPILARQKLMKANGATAALGGAMVKGEKEFDPVAAIAVLRTANAVATTFGDYFPAGSESGQETTASPKIWQDMAGFQAKLAEFRKDTEAAVADLPSEPAMYEAEAFKAAFAAVAENCKSCHEAYRVEKK